MPASEIETGVVYCGDNLPLLRRFPAESVDLVYLDPPFFTNKRYAGFEDRWPEGIEGYVAWVRERAVELRRLLRPTGSLYLHCDWHAVHYLKVMLDGVFGRACFLNDVVWLYGLGGSSRRYWPRKHDDLLWYSKVPDGHYFEPPTMPAGSNRMRGQRKKVPDYWDIPTLNNMARERLGYPTQKPLALLRRIVESSSRPGDVVLDPFAGSGTALVAAHELGRRWVGIDASAGAVETIAARLAALGAGVGVVAADGTATE